MSDEAANLLRVAIFGVVAGALYWLVTYEWFGVVALLLLGFASGFAALWLILQQRREPGQREDFGDTVRRLAGVPRRDPAGPSDYAADHLAVLPLPSIWPLVVAAGVAVLITGLVYGLWLLLVGVVVVVLGLWGWTSAVNRETRYGRLGAGADQGRSVDDGE
ncbi:MAG TPA: cytochrome c oxidase subunit 4 [Actinomycetota bacterium]|jgi:Cytochrome c oxidase subunit IV